jgi:hypothetical protein
MQISATVHSISAEPVEITVEVNGQPMKAKVEGVVLEVVADDGSTSPTFRYVPADAQAELMLFRPGQAVRVTVEPV